MKQSKSDVGGRAEFVGKKPFTERYMPEEFNPVKTKLVDPTGEYVGEVKENTDGSKEFVGKKFNPVKTEIPTHHIETHTPKLNEEQPEPQIKTTAAFDNSRLEFLRMQIGPVQNFYQTLGNILYSLSMRLDVAEAKIESLKAFSDQLNLERALYKRYAEYCKENELQWSEPGFVEFIREYAKEEEDETRTEK